MRIPWQVYVEHVKVKVIAAGRFDIATQLFHCMMIRCSP